MRFQNLLLRLFTLFFFFLPSCRIVFAQHESLPFDRQYMETFSDQLGGWLSKKNVRGHNEGFQFSDQLVEDFANRIDPRCFYFSTLEIVPSKDLKLVDSLNSISVLARNRYFETTKLSKAKEKILDKSDLLISIRYLESIAETRASSLIELNRRRLELANLKSEIARFYLETAEKVVISSGTQTEKPFDNLICRKIFHGAISSRWAKGIFVTDDAPEIANDWYRVQLANGTVGQRILNPWDIKTANKFSFEAADEIVAIVSSEGKLESIVGVPKEFARHLLNKVDGQSVSLILLNTSTGEIRSVLVERPKNETKSASRLFTNANSDLEQLGSTKLGYIRFLDFGNISINDAVRSNLIAFNNAKADGLILDFRTCNSFNITGGAEFVSFFMKKCPLQYLPRNSKKFKDVLGHGPVVWEKPVLLLTNEHTGGVYEQVSITLGGSPNVIVVGSKTKGHSLCPMIIPLSKDDDIWPKTRIVVPRFELANKGIAINQNGTLPEINLIDSKKNRKNLRPVATEIFNSYLKRKAEQKIEWEYENAFEDLDSPNLATIEIMLIAQKFLETLNEKKRTQHIN